MMMGGKCRGRGGTSECGVGRVGTGDERRGTWHGEGGARGMSLVRLC
jgi:hypothetical protein